MHPYLIVWTENTLQMLGETLEKCGKVSFFVVFEAYDVSSGCAWFSMAWWLSLYYFNLVEQNDLKHFLSHLKGADVNFM